MTAIVKCEDCGRPGRLGNTIRTYVMSTLSAAHTEIVLCWPCFTARSAKRGASTRFTIRDRVHVA